MTVRCRSIALSKLDPSSTVGGRLAERLDKLGERLAHHRFDHASRPGARTKAKRGGSGGSLAAVGGERRARERPRVGVLGVEPGKHLGEQRRVLDAAREHTDMIERARQHQRTGARNEAMGRLEADHAAERRRPDHRAVGLRADRARHHVRRRPPRPSRSTSRPACAPDRAGCAVLPGWK